ncbi:transcriptional regulator, TetR family [Geomicrobium sp. JCM 19037]|nr:transcriptional regulator, TetR family [Geomicrobium sp. JCM 19037]
MMETHSLRERKKEATRASIADCAFQLAQKYGVDGFGIQDIANDAMISRRTFSNYFSCKEEAIAHAAFIFDKNIDLLSMSVDINEETPLSLIKYGLKNQRVFENIERKHQIVQLGRTNKTLMLYIYGTFTEIQRHSVDALKAHFGHRYPDYYYQLLLGAVISAVIPTTDSQGSIRLPEQLTESHFNDYLDDVFLTLENGFSH